MVNVDTCYTNSSMQNFCLKAVPPLDDGAPYSGIGEQELHLLPSKLRSNYTRVYENLPTDITHRYYWQYGTVKHTNQSKKIISSVLIELDSDQGNTICILYHIIQG